jgi:hypothetical protein
MISSHPLSGLKGLGGSIQNGELQKNGTESAAWCISRFYLRPDLGVVQSNAPLRSNGA